jgi:hypothetical protein
VERSLSHHLQPPHHRAVTLVTARPGTPVRPLENAWRIIMKVQFAG